MGQRNCLWTLFFRINDFCDSCSSCIWTLFVVAFCCCIMGILFGFFSVAFYYVSFLPTAPSESLQHTDMYESIDEHNDVKRAVYTEGADSFNYDYNEEPEYGDLKFRNKRNFTNSVTSSIVSSTSLNNEHTSTSGPSDSSSSVTAGSTHGPDSSTGSPVSAKSHNIMEHIRNEVSFTSTPSPQVVEYDPDFSLANIIMDSIYTYSERANIKEPLGLCRRAADVQVPQYNATLFPVEEASEIINCINDLIHNQTRRKLCYHLDGEMHAYLKWLVLTGEPREKHKSTNNGPVTDSFLFPSSDCGKKTSRDQPNCSANRGSSSVNMFQQQYEEDT